MPIYEFACKKCGQQFEEMKKVGDFNAGCPVCGGDAEKLMSASGFVVKGSTNSSIDTIIGADAEKRWKLIEERKNKRNKEQYGSISQDDIKSKDQARVSKLLNRQKDAYNIINKAKADAGVTKRDELNHALKG